MSNDDEFQREAERLQREHDQRAEAAAAQRAAELAREARDGGRDRR